MRPILEKTVVGELHTNCYFVGNPDELFVIDPGADSEILYEKIKKGGFTVKYILLTHCHFDHIGATEELRKLCGGQIGIFEGEKENYKNTQVTLSARYGGKAASDPDFTFSEGDILKSGDFEFEVIHTPGHTSGSVCFLGEKMLFAGDTLFYLSYGRYDFPTGSYSDLSSSINEKLFKLDDDVRVFAGHGDDTTIGREKLSNPIADRGMR